MSIDPLFSKYPELTPYNFVANSPSMFIDKDGRDIWIYFVSSGSVPTEWFGHNSMSVDRKDGKSWYHTAGGNSYPRRDEKYSIPILDDAGRTVDFSEETYQTPDKHGIIQKYMQDERTVFAGRLILPDKVDQEAVEKALVERIQYMSKNFPLDCDQTSGTCTDRVRNIIQDALESEGSMTKEEITNFLNKAIGTNGIPDGIEPENANDRNFDKYKLYTPVDDGKNYLFSQGELNNKSKEQSNDQEE